MSSLSITPEAQVHLENQLAIPEFLDLMSFAREVCLSKEDSFKNALTEIQTGRPDRPESRVVSACGLWGLRMALEMKMEDFRYHYPRHEVVFPVTSAEVEAAPLKYGGRTDRFVQNQIEAFGKALLDEAFHCLGDDAIEQVEKFRNASSREEQLDVIWWLRDRVKEIRDKYKEHPVVSVTPEEITDGTRIFLVSHTDEPGEATQELLLDLNQEAARIDLQVVDDESEATEQLTETPNEQPNNDQQHFYHPGRLSPKLIGKYPDTDLIPTCLGISILVASFFEKVGVPYMHAGVMASDSVRAWHALQDFSEIVYKLAETNGIDLASDPETYLQSNLKKAEEVLSNPETFHAAVLVQDINKEWIQIDINWQGNVYFYTTQGGGRQTIQMSYEELRDVDRYAPGIERILLADTGDASYIFTDAAEPLCSELLSREKADELIELMIKKQARGQDAASVMRTYLHSKITSRQQPMARYCHLLMKLTPEYFEAGRKPLAAYYRKLIDHTIFSQIFSDSKDKDLNASIQRMQTDVRYRERRNDDIRMAPFYVLQNLLIYYSSRVIKSEIDTSHYAVEAGLPRYRIGAAVLSDLATYCQDTLPSTFWLTYWPSHIALLDHLPRSKDPAHIWQLARNIGRIINITALQYKAKAEIIISFLGQGAQ